MKTEQFQELDHLRKMGVRYIKSLSKKYPTIVETTTEIIKLEALLNLPKGTEHFLSDIHGEYQSFEHVLKNGSGVIKRKIDDIFQNRLNEKDKKILATIIYYPKRKLKLVLKNVKNRELFLKKTILQLIEIIRVISSKYTRDKVRKNMPKKYKDIIEELLYNQEKTDKENYYYSIIDTIISLEQGALFIEKFATVIKKLAIDHVHIIGDIFDRGPRADLVMDTIMELPSIDIQWGNHDILWMGAAAGYKVLIANLIRIALKYGNLESLEYGYGINITPLITFAIEQYKDDHANCFIPSDNKNISKNELNYLAKAHKAISIIQFKLEHQLVKKNKELNMDSRLLLDKIDYKKGVINIENKEYKLNDKYFPTIDPNNVSKLTKEEYLLIEKLRYQFIHNEKLQKHINFLFLKGGIYLKYNGNLLFHGAIPFNSEKEFCKVEIENRSYKGKKLMDKFESIVKKGFFASEYSEEREMGEKWYWYLWCGTNSPLFGKSKMTTFERYFIDDKEVHKEKKDNYYRWRSDQKICDKIFKEFNLDPKKSHIINGHVPVKERLGENPVKGNNKIIVIDGGFSKAYQNVTGIAGYTLIYNSWGLLLASHEPFESTEKAIKHELDIRSSIRLIERVNQRKTIKDTDQGETILMKIKDLKMLVKFYKNGTLKQVN